MMRTFIKGLVLGLGFAISLVVVFAVVSKIQFGSSIEHNSEATFKDINEWNNLTINEQIDRSTAIAIARFKSGEDGLKMAYVEKIFKKEDGVELNIYVGDRLDKLDFYSSSRGSDRNGEVIFFTNSPGVQMGKLYLYDDRLIAHGDMPLEVFLRKFDASKSGDLKDNLVNIKKKYSHIQNFHELSLDDKIKKSSAILLTKYQKDSDGSEKNIVIEILKKEQGIDLFYDVGDEIKMAGGPDIYRKFKPIGYVVFMDNNPADIRLSMSYNKGSIPGLDNITLELLKEKCNT